MTFSRRELKGARRTVWLCAIAALAAMAQGRPAASSAAQGESSLGKPNIVFIMADDMGYGDPSCYNPDSKIPTPNIDRLAVEGMRFTDAHSPGAVCVPTRYGLLTGRYPFRMAKKSRGQSRIREGRLTLGGFLQKNGYQTSCVGKWHLGIGDEKPDYSQPLGHGPLERGFDYFFGIHASLDIPPYYYIENDRCIEAPTGKIDASNSPDVSRIQGAFWRAGPIAPGFKHAEVLPKLTDRAVEYVRERSEGAPEQPFFLYFALPAPHTPWLPVESVRGKSGAGDYGDFVVQVDEAVGAVLEALDERGLTDKTLVFFTSDNGPVWRPEDIEKYDHRSTQLLRGKKGDVWEGGHRMPFLARWPERIEAGALCDETICFTDMPATVAALLGEQLPRDAGQDSYNILPALLGEDYDGPIREATVHQGGGRGGVAIRQGPWKMIPHKGSGGFLSPEDGEPKEDDPKGQLYNLDEDLSEENNLWREHPEIVKRLSDLLEKYRKDGRSAP
jgi:arylsulfatase A